MSPTRKPAAPKARAVRAICNGEERGGWRPAALFVFLAVAAACSREVPAARLEVALVESNGSAFVRLTGLAPQDLRTLESGAIDAAGRMLSVTVAGGPLAVAGSYRVADGALEFQPAFPFDRGRDYVVR